MLLKLYLIRHAKSSWDDASLSDHDRPLNKRGKRDAPFMAKLLRKKNIIPDLIISSSAERAIEFTNVIADELNYKKKNIISGKNMYMAGENELLEILNNTDNIYKTVFMIGHNPTMTYFANRLCNYNLDNIPTSGVFGISFKDMKWQDVKFGSGKFESFDFPKKFNEEEKYL